MHIPQLLMLVLLLFVCACGERKSGPISQPTAKQRARAEQIVQDVISSMNANLTANDDRSKILPADLDPARLYHIDDYKISWVAAADGRIQCRYTHKAAARINSADEVLIEFDKDDSVGRVYVARMSPRLEIGTDDISPHLYEVLKSTQKPEQDTEVEK